MTTEQTGTEGKNHEEIKRMIQDKKCSLSINRIPKSTYDRFIAFANEEDFCKDYGFALKYLLDFHEGMIQQGTEALWEEIEMLHKRVSELSTTKESNTKKRIMMNGRELKR